MLWLLILIASVIFLYAYIIRPHKYWAERNVPHIKPWLIVGNMARITFRRTSFSEGLQEICQKFNTRYFGLYQFLYPTLIVTDPDLLKQITIKDFEHFLDHKSFVDDDIDPYFGKNLFQLRGQKWRNMRSTLSPAFTSSKMKSMFVLMSDCAEHFANYFLKTTEPGHHTTVEMKDLFTRYANDVIATCAFGIKCDSLSERNNEFYVMGKRATDFDGIRGFKFFLNTISPFLMKFFKIRVIDVDVGNFFKHVIKSTVEKREEKHIYRPDLINLLMEAKKGKLKYEETVKSKEEDAGFATVEESDVGKVIQSIPEELTFDDMTAQAMIFFLAGFDTVSTLMCHMAHELAIHPNIQKKLQEEIDETIEKCQGGNITYDAITKMKYLDMVICESLRKWPSAVISDRICTKPYTIEAVKPGESSLTLEKGDHIWIPLYAIHRDPENYPDPDKFDPERFSDENKGNINPQVYIPFGLGPRNCIGSRFALLEVKVIFFNLLLKMDIVVSEKTQIPLKLSRTNVNIVAEGGFWLGLKPRIKK